MRKRKLILNQFDFLVLAEVANNPMVFNYGSAILSRSKEIAGGHISQGALNATLKRLCRRKLMTAETVGITGERKRGDRARICYTATSEGISVLKDSATFYREIVARLDSF